MISLLSSARDWLKQNKATAIVWAGRPIAASLGWLGAEIVGGDSVGITESVHPVAEAGAVFVVMIVYTLLDWLVIRKKAQAEKTVRRANKAIKKN